MGRILSIALSVLVWSCTTTVTQESLKHMNGYWEINKVIFPDGNSKAYNVNPYIDYIHVMDMQGHKKKVQPKIDGTYTTSNNVEAFTIIQVNGAFMMHYKNDINEWTEQITAISENTFSVKNEENITYTYNRYVPINIEN